MDPYGYGWEKLHLAVHALAGDGTRKQRLVGAAVYNLIHITPARDIPSELHEDFAQLVKDLTSRQAKGDEGNIQATVDAMSDGDVDRAIEKIISFYDTICQRRESN